MRVILIALCLLTSNSHGKEWNIGSLSIELPERFHIEHSGLADSFAAFVSSDTGHPKEMIVLKREGSVDYEGVIEEANQLLAGMGMSKLAQAPCQEGCTVMRSAGPINPENGKYNLFTVLSVHENVYVITYLGSSALSKGQQFVDSIQEQILAETFNK